MNEVIPALVGIVPRKELWDIIKNEKWYHIPVQSAPKNILNIKYLGFYFPSIFGEKLRYKVIYYSAVKEIEVKKRIELFPDEEEHPRRNLDYYQIHIGEIEELEKPIISKRFRRIVHIPTTFKKLITAEEINDLFNTSPLEDKMYIRLKMINVFPERQYVVNIRKTTYFLDFCVFCKDGNIDIECDGERYHTMPESLTKDRIRNNNLTSYGWSVLRFSSSEINREINLCLEIVKKTINTLGGLSDL